MLTAGASTLLSSPLAGRRACVVDARLALSRYGLLTVARLTAEFDVWLPGELRELLRRPPTEPESLVPRLFCAPLRSVDRRDEAEAIREELGLWDRLPEDAELAAMRTHHLGDRADECVLPAGIDRALRPRSEQLARGLDLLLTRSRYDSPPLLAACFRDAAALTAALSPYRAFLLTRLESDLRGSPAICEYLDAWGVRSARAPRAGGRCAAVLHNTLVSAGLTPLIWAGVPFAAVYIIIPGAPVLGGPRPELSDEDVAARWARAQVFWHPL